MIVKLTQFYTAGNVSIPSELFYICELGKYMKINNHQLSLEGVRISNVLKHSCYWDYFLFSISEGWLINTNIDVSNVDINTLDLSNIVNRIFTEDVPNPEPSEIRERRKIDDTYNRTHASTWQIGFDSKENGVWVWDSGSTAYEDVHALSVFVEQAGLCLVSIVAYAMVQRFLGSGMTTLNFVIRLSVLSRRNAMVDMILLHEKTAAFKDIVNIEYSNIDLEQIDNQGYLAWLFLGRETGFPCREYSVAEKKANFKNLDLKVGDVVGLYTRKNIRGATKDIEKFNFAIIQRVDAKNISLLCVETTKTRHALHKEVDELDYNTKRLFGGKIDINKFKSKGFTIAWEDIGIEYAMNEEGYFIAAIQNDDIYEDFLIEDRDGNSTYIALSSVDYIYWLLKDYNQKFNEERFKKRYYENNTIPEYDRYYG